jgi:hypothetical protein
LLKSRQQSRQSLVHQGFGWIARKKSSGAIPYESTTYEIAPERVDGPPRLRFFARRNTTFVHKSSAMIRDLVLIRLDSGARIPLSGR